ncbi:hypothetical protein P4646_19995 [Peribacillus simplex]|uniref:hypothetical protein n=1 Tax=Peribacillus simplex TaxID=1478 RepID=UPI002E227C57|nr:hypothetical protein [Peribacillus simplex]MED4096812.1 hypothetical protein [Peribacillus simplex]
MIKQIIVNGKVHYKIGDLAEMYGVSPSVMKRILKEQNTETTTISGFGRMLFAVDKNVSVEVKGDDTITKTFKEIIKERVAKKAAAKQKRAEKEQAKNEQTEKKNGVAEPISDNIEKGQSDIERERIEKLQQEHADVLKEGNMCGVKFHKAGKMLELTEIMDKHLGKGNIWKNTNVDDIEIMRPCLAELKSVIEAWTNSVAS